MSRFHVEIEEEDGTYWMAVVSKVNPVMVKGRRYGPGTRLTLHSGDSFELAEYEVQVHAARAAGAEPTRKRQGAAAVERPADAGAELEPTSTQIRRSADRLTPSACSTNPRLPGGDSAKSALRAARLGRSAGTAASGAPPRCVPRRRRRAAQGAVAADSDDAARLRRDHARGR